MSLEIKTFKAKDHYVRATIYGPSGSGKTVFSGTAPKPIFASSEQGLLSIVSTLGYNPEYVDIKSVEDLESLYELLKSGKHNRETLIIDSLTEVNEIIKEGIEKRTGKKMQIQDWGDLFDKIKGIIRGIKELPMNVIIICQEKILTDKDGGVTSKVPMLNGKNATQIAYMMDIVGYTYLDDDEKHRITTKPDGRLETKDRTGKISEFGFSAPTDFKERIKAMSTIDAGNEISKTYDSKTGEELTPELLRKRADEKEAAERKAITDEIEELTGRISKADEIIEKEEFDRQNGEDNPTNTDQFRKAHAAQLSKIQKMKAGRLKLVDRKKFLEIKLTPKDKKEDEEETKKTDEVKSEKKKEKKKELTTKEKLDARSKKKKPSEKAPEEDVSDKEDENTDKQADDTEEKPSEEDETFPREEEGATQADHDEAEADMIGAEKDTESE